MQAAEHDLPPLAGGVPAPRAGEEGLPPRLALRGLSHRFGARRVLDGLGFEVGQGEIVALMGPNGSGKSTTLHVLMGLVVPEAGEIVLDGAPVEPGGRALRRRMGVVFQAPSLDGRLSARENLALTAALHGLRGRAGQARVETLLAFASLAERADDPVLQFSGGMKRRLELVRALVAEPALLVLDEATNGLDEQGFRDTWERIERLRRERGLSVLATTHRADEAERADRVVIVDRGRVIAEGTPDALCRQVSGDVLTIEADAPEALAAELGARLGLAPRVVGGRVLVERERAHELVPRVVEALPAGRIRSISMRRPTLADVFVKLAGRALAEEEGAGAS